VEPLIFTHPHWEALTPNTQLAYHQLKTQAFIQNFYLAGGTGLPLHLAYEGARFRLRLDKKAVITGLINLSDAFRTYLPQPFLRPTPVSVQFVELGGSLIPFEKKLVSTPMQTMLPSTISQYSCPAMRSNSSRVIG
jgi:hypothetical protein